MSAVLRKATAKADIACNDLYCGHRDHPVRLNKRKMEDQLREAAIHDQDLEKHDAAPPK